ncbi:MAG TPA: hypothetical protein VGO37_15665 [Steroidobacteraceae bacterium]|jgi:hypothetical protein|nr:hypothetical protein [Steroidobacteraceae bacterium]
MQMTSQEANTICAHLTAARLLLQQSERETADAVHRIEVIEGQLCAADVTYVGDAGAAKVALDNVVDELVQLGRNEPDPAGSRPTYNPELLPGVSDAINQIGKAVELLQFVRGSGR